MTKKERKTEKRSEKKKHQKQVEIRKRFMVVIKIQIDILNRKIHTEKDR